MQRSNTHEPWILKLVPDKYKTRETDIKVVDADPGQLEFVTNYLKTKEMCERAVGDYPWVLKFVPDKFKT